MKISLLKLFLIYLRVGAFTFGGGYAMIPVFERELIKRYKLFNKDDFYDTLAICQSIPGALAVNFAVYTGLRLRGIKGAIVTTLAVTIPSFVFILIFATFLYNYIEHPIVLSFFKGVRLSIVALMTVAGARLFIRYKNYFGIIMMTFSFALIVFANLHPLILILVAGIIGYLYSGQKVVAHNEST